MNNKDQLVNISLPKFNEILRDQTSQVVLKQSSVQGSFYRALGHTK